MTTSPCSGRILAVLLTCGTLLATPLHAEESAPRTQEIKPQEPKVLPPKTQELKGPEPARPPPELKQEPPVRSLTLTVKLALLSDQRTAPWTIEVDTKGQDVVLSGKVSSETEKLAAAEVARQVEGGQVSGQHAGGGS